jgi:hypothetical protein
VTSGLYAAPPGDEVNYQHDDREHQQDVNESTKRVGADQTEQPEHEQNNEYCPQHSFPPGSGFLCFVSQGAGALVFEKKYFRKFFRSFPLA